MTIEIIEFFIGLERRPELGSTRNSSPGSRSHQPRGADAVGWDGTVTLPSDLSWKTIFQHHPKPVDRCRDAGRYGCGLHMGADQCVRRACVRNLSVVQRHRDLKGAAPESIQRGPKDKKRASPDWVRSRATRGLYYCHGHGASDVTETICGHHHFGGEPTGARQRVVDVKSKATLNRNGLAGPDYAGIQLTRGSVPDL